MEYVFYGLLAVAFIAFVVLVIRSYRKKLASGCCSASDESVKKNKVADKDKSHYPYEKTLVVDGMVCKNCSARVENALNSIDGVWAEADVSSGRVTVRMKREIEDKVLKKAVNDIGAYTVMKAE
jgi:copper chaperone